MQLAIIIGLCCLCEQLDAWQAIGFRPVAAYRAGTAMAVPHLWGT